MPANKKAKRPLDDAFENMHEDELDEEWGDEFLSKSEIKREAEQAHVLGLRLLALRSEQLTQLFKQDALSEKLYDALMDAKRITSHGALRRQKQYIGKLMRQVEAVPIQTQLIYWENAAKVEQTKFHQLERWRERLLGTESAIALAELLQDYPEIDRQHVRNLIRNAQKEASLNKPPKASRELFQYLRQLVDE